MTSLPFKSTRYNVPYIVVSGSGTIGNELNVKGQTHLSESATIAQDIIYGGSLNIVPGSGISFDGKTMTNTGQVTPLTSGENIAISSGTVGVVDSPTFSNLTVEGQTNSTLFVGGFHNQGGLVLAGTAPAGDISLSAPGITFEYVNGGGVLWGGIKNLPTSLGVAGSGTLASAINTEFFFNPSGSVAIRDYGNDTYRIYTPVTIDQIASMPIGSGLGIASGSLYATGGASSGTTIQSILGSTVTLTSTIPVSEGMYNVALYAAIPNSVFTNSSITYASLSIVNSATVATSAPFQQIVSVPPNLMAYANSTLTNVQFSDASGSTILPSWRETGTINTETSTYWILLNNGVGASSTLYVVIQYFTNGQSVLNSGTTGVGPKLPEYYGDAYGTNDTGSIVFPDLYDNFAGSALSSLWSRQNTGAVTVNNGINIGGGNNTYTFVASTQAFTYPVVFEIGYPVIDSAAGAPGYPFGVTTSTVLTTGVTNNSDLRYQDGYDTFLAVSAPEGIEYASTSGNPTNAGGTIGTIGFTQGFGWDNVNPYVSSFQSGTMVWSVVSTVISVGNFHGYIGQGNGGGGAGTLFVQYARVRAYPPSASLMPSMVGSLSGTVNVTMGMQYRDPQLGIIDSYPISTVSVAGGQTTSFVLPVSVTAGSIMVNYIGSGVYFSIKVS